MYHVSVHELAERVAIHIRREELLRPGDRVGVAVSGGVDSVALLRLLIELRQELGIVLSVVHFNHKLRGAESDADQAFVASLAREHGLEFRAASGDVAQLAAEEGSGVEAAARELRYGFFRELLGEGESTDVELNKIATAHTLDDQAETVLMRLIRGSGLKGLGGIYPRIVVEQENGDAHGEIIRPLLGTRRRELEHYLEDLKQPWREDSTNTDARFTRNRVRSLVLPLLEREFNPAVVESFAELAEIARDEEDYWENEISGWLGTVVQWLQPEWTRGLPGFDGSQSLVQIQPSNLELLERLEQPGPAIMNASLSRPWLLTEPRAVQRRVIKAIGEHAGIPLEFKHIEEILRFAAEDGPAGKKLSLPLGWQLLREPEAMIFLTPDLRRQERIPDYEYALPLPGRVSVPELGAVIEVLRFVPQSTAPDSQPAEYNPQQLLRAELLPVQLIVRNWRPGDRFWPAHTKSAKKIKDLLQELHVPQPARRLWPVAASADEIVWMRGFPVPARLLAKAGEEAVLIQEAPWEVEQNAI
jgi:tRNA(Ile)-lysidine synthase